MPTLLYLHGFNSSPESAKAQQTQQWFGQNAPGTEFICPSLPPYADRAMALLCEIVEARLPEPVFIIGSSMGGFFASCLTERYAQFNVAAVLINPAVSPARGLDKWLGENSNYHSGETWLFEPHHIDEYQRWDPTAIKNKNNYLVLLQSADEVLDYRDAEQRYQGCKIILESGGDHSFIDYHRHLETVYQFLLSAVPSNPQLQPDL
ncbi:alpha/beta hydrolase [SAR92 clade bacterium H455]|uniref:Alpha/beta hydrolase n=1 Tax=SAR92 clade bacterium H455 TaxID=2974818 RepID=A0ABY5TNL7_9GAMM|nr:alpha/beta hydrolase [SAR92 clade bacterium H455]